jgi:hypothetical protein
LLKTFKIHLKIGIKPAKRIIYLDLRSTLKRDFIKTVAKLDYFVNFGHTEIK